MKTFGKELTKSILHKKLKRENERQNQHHLSSPSMDSTREEEKGKTKTITWRIVLEKEMADKGHSWNTIHQLSKDREKWKRIVRGLCFIGGEKGLSQ